MTQFEIAFMPPRHCDLLLGLLTAIERSTQIDVAMTATSHAAISAVGPFCGTFAFATAVEPGLIELVAVEPSVELAAVEPAVELVALVVVEFAVEILNAALASRPHFTVTITSLTSYGVAPVRVALLGMRFAWGTPHD
jgi:hypothetical protein